MWERTVTNQCYPHEIQTGDLLVAICDYPITFDESGWTLVKVPKWKRFWMFITLRKMGYAYHKTVTD